jgi:hypothetical protein
LLTLYNTLKFYTKYLENLEPNNKMQPKTLLVILGGFAAVALAAPSPIPADNAVDAPAGSLAPGSVYQWQAAGGCETDWNKHCQQECVYEVDQHGWACSDITSAIEGSGCFIGWSTCECTCFW